MTKKHKDEIPKEDFIKFLASLTPEDINRLISEKGKPPKLVKPIFYFDEH